jgi:hypothetical protein
MGFLGLSKLASGLIILITEGDDNKYSLWSELMDASLWFRVD